MIDIIVLFFFLLALFMYICTATVIVIAAYCIIYIFNKLRGKKKDEQV